MRSLLAIIAAIGLIVGGATRAASAASSCAGARAGQPRDARDHHGHALLRGVSASAHVAFTGRGHAAHGGLDGSLPPALAAQSAPPLAPRLHVSQAQAPRIGIGSDLANRGIRRSRAPPLE